MTESQVLLKIAGDGDEAIREVGDVERAAQRFGRTKVEGKLRVDAEQAKAETRTVETALGRIAGNVAEARVQIQAEGAQAQIDRVRERLVNLGQQEPTPKVAVATATATAQLERFEQKLAALGRQETTATVKIDTKAAMANLAGLTQRILGLVKVPGLIALAGVAAQAIGAIGAAAIGLVGALGPASGALVAVPGFLLAIQQAAGTAKLAFIGLGKQVGEAFTKQLEKPTIAGRDFATRLKEFAPLVRQLQVAAQRGLLPGLARGLSLAAQNFGPLKNVVAVTAKALGGLAVEAGRLVGSAAFGRDLQTIGTRNASIITTLGRAGLALGSALRHVLVAAGPLLSWMANLALAWAKGADSAAQAGRETGALGRFFEGTQGALSSLMGILGHFAGALFNIGKAAAPMGRELLTALEGSAAAFRRFTGSAEGQNKLRAYFDAAKPGIFELGRLTRDLVGAFARLAAQPGLSLMVAKLREVIPALEKMIASATVAFGPVLIEAAVNVARLLSVFAAESGPLIAFVSTLGNIAGGLATILEKAPLLSSVLVAIAGAAAVLKAIQFTALISGIPTLIAAFTGLQARMAGVTLASIGMRVQMLATGAAMYFWAAASGIAAVATTAFGVALAILTSPITLVILAITALILAGVALYRNWDTVKEKVGAVWGWLQGAAGTVWGGIKSTISAANKTVTDGVKAEWQDTKSDLSRAWNGIKSLASSIWAQVPGPIKRAGESAASGLSQAWTKMKADAPGAWNTIKGHASTIWGGIKTAITNPVGTAKSVASRAWTSISSTAVSAWGKIKTEADDKFGSLKGIVGRAAARVKEEAPKFLASGRALIEGLGRGIASAASKVYNKIAEIAGKVRDKMKSALSIRSPSRVFFEIGENVSAGLAQGIAAGAGDVLRAVQRDLAGPLAAAIPSSLGAGLTGALDVRVPAPSPASAASAGAGLVQNNTIYPQGRDYPDAGFFFADLEERYRASGGRTR